MTEELIWNDASPQQMEYPPAGELVWTADLQGHIVRGRHHWEPGMDLPGGDWTDEAGQTILPRWWLGLDESVDAPSPPRP